VSRPWKRSLVGRIKEDLEQSKAFSAAGARVKALERSATGAVISGNYGTS
jgi:hypothetical protein